MNLLAGRKAAAAVAKIVDRFNRLLAAAAIATAPRATTPVD